MNRIVTVSKTCPDYLERAVKMLDEYDNLKVNGLNAGQLYEIEQKNPEIFENIKEIIKNGRWYPAAGLWNKAEEKVSNERLIREILYSVNWLKEKFGGMFRVFVGNRVCCASFPQIVYNGRFDCAVLSEGSEMYWLDGEDRFRICVMGGVDTTDIEVLNEIDIKDTEFITYEELLHNTFSMPLDLKSVKLQKAEDILSDAEKAVIMAEKASAQSGIDSSAEIRDCWFDIFSGNDDIAAEKAKKIADGKRACDIVKINNADVKVNVFKFSEDGSGKKVIRIEETAGTEKNISVMCDEINAGFRCEIEPYEIATYKIDAEGFVREVFIYE